MDWYDWTRFTLMIALAMAALSCIASMKKSLIKNGLQPEATSAIKESRFFFLLTLIVSAATKDLNDVASWLS